MRIGCERPRIYTGVPENDPRGIESEGIGGSRASHANTPHHGNTRLVAHLRSPRTSRSAPSGARQAGVAGLHRHYLPLCGPGSMADLHIEFNTPLGIAPVAARHRAPFFQPASDFGVDRTAGGRHVEDGRVQAGRRRTHSGLSHSCERPTSASPARSAQTISVPLARRETMRISRSAANSRRTGAREAADISGTRDRSSSVRTGRTPSRARTRFAARSDSRRRVRRELRCLLPNEGPYDIFAFLSRK